MMKKILFTSLIAVLPVLSLGNTYFCKFSDEELVYYIMLESRGTLPAYCDCPNDFDGFGNFCSDKSQYFKDIKTKVLCFPTEVSQKMIDEFKWDYCPSEY